jgi:translocator protein
MSKDRLRQVLVVGSFIFAIALNAAANIIPLNGQTTGEIADRFQVFVQPAGYVFSIWSLIYIGQLAFVLHSLRPSRLEDPLLRRIGLLPVAIAVLNGVWILAWHWELFPLTLLIMVALLVALIWLYLRAGFEHTARPSGHGPASAERWFVQLPFSVYLGWITVATIANVAVVGNWADVPTFGIAPELIAAAVLVVGLGIAAAVLLRTADVAYGAVIVWAYVGVVVKEFETTVVALAAGAAVLVVAALIAAAVVGRLPWTRVAPSS